VKGRLGECQYGFRPNRSKSAGRSAACKRFLLRCDDGSTAGGVLSPLLFILLMDQVLKQATMEAAKGDHSGTLAYADDVGLITCSAKELQDTINKWCTLHSSKDELSKAK